MSDETAKTIKEYLLQIAENLPLLEQFNYANHFTKKLTLMEMHTIALVGKLGSPQMSELARRGHVTVGTMTVMVNKLAKKGYVRRTRDGNDRRVVHVSLTTRGQKVDQVHQEYHQRINEKIMAVLTESEQKQVAKLMRKIASAFG